MISTLPPVPALIEIADKACQEAAIRVDAALGVKTYKENMQRIADRAKRGVSEPRAKRQP